jgi:hypothetical protein
MGQPVTPPAAGGGVTAMLVFLVIGAFGLMIMLFVGSGTSPVAFPSTPIPAQPAYPATAQPDDLGAQQDQRPGPDYYNAGPYYPVTPQRVYPNRPRVVGPYPPAPYPVPERSHERDHDRDSQR